jgi:dTDP-4-amino-4,6-dideoxygalactose transaminase
VGTLVHYPRAVHQHPAYAHLARPGRLARSERLAREVLSLPLYPELTDDEAARVADAAREACDA